MNDYPNFDELKKLYPEVGFEIFKTEDGFLFGNQTLKGKKLPWVHFKGASEDDVLSRILRLWHWEKTNKTLPLPFDITQEPVIKEQKIQEKKSGRFVGTKWVKEVATGLKFRLPKDEAEESVKSGKFIFSGPRA